MEPKDQERPDARPAERTKLDDWFNDFKGPPLSPAENIKLGMRWLQPPFEIAYEKPKKK